MRLHCRYERFQANPTTLEVNVFYEAHSQQRCSEQRGWLRGSRLRLSQRFSFSRCWSSSLLARCSLPPPRPSQQPQLFPIWRPSESQTRLKMAPTSRGGSHAFTGDFFKKRSHPPSLVLSDKLQLSEEQPRLKLTSSFCLNCAVI